MTQFYIIEVIQYTNGEYGHIVHYAFDEDPNKAKLKAESKYHEVLAAAAVSDTLTHSAILFDTKCFPKLNYCYTHPQPTPAPDPEPTEE